MRRLASVVLALSLSFAPLVQAQQSARPVLPVPVGIGAAGVAAPQATVGTLATALPVSGVAAPAPIVSPKASLELPAAVIESPAAADRRGVAEAAPIAAVAGDGLARSLGRAERSDRESGDVGEKARVMGALFDRSAARPELATQPDESESHARWNEELTAPGRILGGRGIKHTISIFGSARLVPPEVAGPKLAEARAKAKASPAARKVQTELAAARRSAKMSRYYAEAQRFARMVGELSGGAVAIITGAGPGIMEAGNRGATEGGAPSVGFNIKLPREQDANPFVTPGMGYQFTDFSTRQKGLRKNSDALTFFPGGYGTLYELFEALTLIQTGQHPRVPIVLFGKRFWKEVLDLPALARQGMISPADLNLFVFVETAEQGWAAVAKQYPDRPEYAKRPPKPVRRPRR